MIFKKWKELHFTLVVLVVMPGGDHVQHNECMNVVVVATRTHDMMPP